MFRRDKVFISGNSNRKSFASPTLRSLTQPKFKMTIHLRTIFNILLVGSSLLASAAIGQSGPHKPGGANVPHISCQKALYDAIDKNKFERMRELQGFAQTQRATLSLPIKEDGSIDSEATKLDSSSGNAVLDAKLLDLVRNLGVMPACSHGPGQGSWVVGVDWLAMDGSADQRRVLPNLKLKSETTEVIDQPMPEYPKAAIINDIQGTTVVLVTPAADGSVASVVIAKSSGSKILDHAAETAALKVRFKPFALGPDQKVTGFQIPYAFSLSQNGHIPGEENASSALAAQRTAAQHGDANAQFALGVLALRGGGGGSDADPKAARAWFEMAAGQGHARAQFNLAEAFRNGIGGTPDPIRAMTLYVQSAQQGLALAQCYVGIAHETGQQGNVDLPTAVDWYRKAVAQNNACAQYHLAALLFAGQGLPKSEQQALALLRQAADQGLPEAQSWLGNLYMSGRMVSQDDRAALVWLQLAARQSDALAFANLSYLAQQGRAGERNRPLSFAYMTLALRLADNERMRTRLANDLAVLKAQLSDAEIVQGSQAATNWRTGMALPTIAQRIDAQNATTNKPVP